MTTATDANRDYLVLEKSTGEGSGYAVYKHPESDVYELWNIPMYGGIERLEGLFPAIADCVTEAESWT